MSQPLLSASSIFGAVDLKEDVVEVPEWGGSVRLVQMSAAESMQLTRDMATQEGADNGMYLMLIYSARNADSTRIFSPDEADPEQPNAPVKWTKAIEQLKQKNFYVLDMLQRRALTLNAMTVPAKEALKKD